jgi:transposase-like protein
MPLTENNEPEYRANKRPLCPHCDTTISLTMCQDLGLFGEADHEITCPECEKEFTVTTTIKITYDTHR